MSRLPAKAPAAPLIDTAMLKRAAFDALGLKDEHLKLAGERLVQALDASGRFGEDWQARLKAIEMLVSLGMLGPTAAKATQHTQMGQANVTVVIESPASGRAQLEDVVVIEGDDMVDGA